MGHRRSRIARQWLGDSRGAAAVEFAILAIPLLGILMCSIQVALYFLFTEEVQSIAQKAGRLVMTGQSTSVANQTGTLSQAGFQTLICGLAPSPFNSNGVCKLMIDVQSASSFTAINTAAFVPTYDSNGNPTNLNYSTGNPGDIVILRVMYSWPVLGGAILAPGLANQSNGSVLMVGTAVFKNEPFPSS